MILCNDTLMFTHVAVSAWALQPSTNTRLCRLAGLHILVSLPGISGSHATGVLAALECLFARPDWFVDFCSSVDVQYMSRHVDFI